MQVWFKLCVLMSMFLQVECVVFDATFVVSYIQQPLGVIKNPFQVRSRLLCALECSKHEDCKLFVYYKDSRLCSMSSDHVELSGEAIVDNVYMKVAGDVCVCEEGWSCNPIANTCVWMSSEGMMPTDASDYCTSQNGYLVVLDSEESRQWFIELRESIPATINEGYIVGATLVNGDWTWSNGVIISLNQFAPDQPDNSGNCLQMFGQWNSFMWDDIPCASGTIKFACEKSC